jgi:hypothetical protein
VNEDGGVGFVARYQPIPGLTCNVVDGVTFLTRICIVYVWPGSTALCGVWQIRDGAAVALGTVNWRTLAPWKAVPDAATTPDRLGSVSLKMSAW